MIRLDSIHHTYRGGSGPVHALRGVDLNVQRGEVFGVIGRSGAGKSSLVRTINLLNRPDQGRVWVDGQDLTALNAAGLRRARHGIGMVFQHFNLLSSRTVFDNVALPLELAGLSRREIRERVQPLLELVGLGALGERYPAQISGGQKQRVGIARALANRPTLLLCDEATSALDPQTTQSILQLLLDINQRMGLTIVLITHEMDVIRSICDRVAVLDGGRVVESGPVTQVFLHPQHPTTQRFVQEAEHLDENAQLDALAHVPGHIVRLTFVGEATYGAALSEVVRAHGLGFNLLGGRIERIKHTPCGQLTLALQGEAAQVQAAIEALRTQGTTVEVIR